MSSFESDGSRGGPRLVHRSASFADPTRLRATSFVKKDARGTLVDSLLKPGRPDARNPFKGFGLATAYCPPASVALTKCASAPAICFADRVLSGEFGDNGLGECADNANEPLPQAWRCRGCASTDRSLLSRNADASFVCDQCGTVDGGPDLWHADRQKNCPRDEDKTVVAEEVKKDAAQLASEAIAGGAECTQDRRKRHLKTSGGTRIGKAARHKYDLTAAQARVETQVVRESRERIDGDPRFVRKRDRVLRDTEAVFDQLKPFDARLQRHIRIETVRVLTNGFEHAKTCAGACCQIALESRANSLIALCTVQKCLESLVCNDACDGDGDGDIGGVASIAPECSKHELLKSLDCVKQLQLQGGAGATQRAQVSAVVGLVMGWTPEEVALSCADATLGRTEPQANGVAGALPTAQSLSPTQAGPPSHFALPPALHHQHLYAAQGAAWSPLTPSSLEEDENSPRGDRSASDPVWNVIRSIHGAWRLANVRADVKQAATAAVQEQALADWIRHENTLPMCVLGVAMLRAAAIKLGLEDGTNELLEQYCFQYSISPTTARQAAEQLVGIMTVGASTTMGVFGDGIF